MNSPTRLPTVSVIIPAYNAERWLAEAIDSVLAQTYPPLEILVGDDGSTDRTAEIAAGYGDAIRLLRQPNRGPNSIRNAFLPSARGEWFFNLDSDDKLPPDFLEKIATQAAALTDPSIAYLYPDFQHFGDDDAFFRSEEFSMERLKQGPYIVMSALIRTAVGRRFGYNPALPCWMDYDFYVTLAEAGFRGQAFHGCPILYRIHTDSVTGSARAPERQLESMRGIVARHPVFFSRREAKRAVTRYRLSVDSEAARYGAILKDVLKAALTPPPVCCRLWLLMALQSVPPLVSGGALGGRRPREAAEAGLSPWRRHARHAARTALRLLRRLALALQPGRRPAIWLTLLEPQANLHSGHRLMYTLSLQGGARFHLPDADTATAAPGDYVFPVSCRDELYPGALFEAVRTAVREDAPDIILLCHATATGGGAPVPAPADAAPQPGTFLIRQDLYRRCGGDPARCLQAAQTQRRISAILLNRYPAA